MDNNLSVLTVNEAVAELRGVYSTVINKGLEIASLPSVMLWGAPGVGKSQGVRQLAKHLSADTGKEVRITDVRLLLFNPIDLRGIPTANADKTLAIWLRPQIFDMSSSDSVVNILFLDEITAAPQSVQASAYQITLDRTIGEHKLPKNCIVIGAGNRVTDKSVAVKMPKALANRLCHLEIKADFTSWKQWAVANNIHYKICGFLSFNQSLLNNFSADDFVAFATPRSWEMASQLLHASDGNIDKVFNLISGCVGLGVAVELRTWCEVYNDIPSMEDIFAGKTQQVPKNPDSMYAVMSGMVAYARTQTNNHTAIANSLKYALLMPPDYSWVLIKDYFSFSQEFKLWLLKLPELSDWLKRNSKYLL